jgi:hypothetical protein
MSQATNPIETLHTAMAHAAYVALAVLGGCAWS